jgi:integrase
MATVITCLNSAEKKRIIPYNPAMLIDNKPKKVEYEGAKIYTEQEINILLEKSKNDPLEIIIMLTVFYGLRRSEAIGIKWKNVEFSNNTILINEAVVPGTKKLHIKSTKNKSSRDYLSMPDMIRERLLAWKQQQEEYKLLQPNEYVDSGYICTNIRGEMLNPDYVSAHFQILLKNIGMPSIRYHDLRHSSASYLYALGYDVLKIKVWLRHADIKTTEKYIHMGLGVRKEIADTISERLRI